MLGDVVAKQGDNIQPWRTPFPIWNQSIVPCPVLTIAPCVSEAMDPHKNKSWKKSGGKLKAVNIHAEEVQREYSAVQKYQRGETEPVVAHSTYGIFQAAD